MAQENGTQDAAAEGESEGGTPDFDAFLAAEGGIIDLSDGEDPEASAASDYGVEDLNGAFEGDDKPDGDAVDAKAGIEPKADAPKAKLEEKEPRIQRRLLDSERRVVELANENKELRQKLQESSPRARSGDVLDNLMHDIAGSLGIKPDDRRVMDELQRVGMQIVAELAGDADDPNIRQLRQEREQSRKHREIQDQIDSLRRERDEAQHGQRQQQAVQLIGSEMKGMDAESQYPYLHAAEADAPSTVWDGIQVLIEQGYKIDTDERAREAIGFVCQRLDDDYRSTSEKLSKAGKKAAEAPTQGETRGARRDGQAQKADRGRDRSAGRTVTASGVGSRAAPPVDAPKSQDEIFEELIREERIERQRRDASRRGRSS